MGVFAVDSLAEGLLVDLCEVAQLVVFGQAVEGGVLAWEVGGVLAHCCLDVGLFDVVGEVDEQGFAESFSELLEVADCEVNVLVLWPAKRALQSIDVTMPQLPYQKGATGAFLLLLIQKRAILERKPLEDATHQQRKLLPFPWICRIMTAIHEGVSLHRMTMQVAEEKHICKLLDAEYEFLQVEDLRMVYFGWIFPFFIEIVAGNVGPVVAVDHTVWVQHRNDLEHEILPQFLCFFVI